MSDPDITKVRKQHYTPLFYNLSGAVIVPLLILLAVFTFVTLRREIASEMSRCTQKGEMVLKTIHGEYLSVLADSEKPLQFVPKEELRKQLEGFRDMFQLYEVDLINPSTQESLLGAEESAPALNARARQALMDAVPESLSAKRHGQPYFMKTDFKMTSKNQMVFGYIPFHYKAGSQVYVLVTVFKTSFNEVVQKTAASFGIMFLFTFLVGLAISLFLSYRIARPIHAINNACNAMLTGNLGLQVKVKTGDELELMAQNFNRMSQALMIMKRQAEDSNPLTQLPGNRQIMAELVHRLEENKKFVYFHVDLDHFKAFNDHYGLGRGDDVLRRTGEILKQCLTLSGDRGHFLGHQGGDDFVLIIEYHEAKEIADLVCKKFDLAMQEFYDKEDLQRGYFMGEEARSSSLSGDVEIKRQPLMSISLAGVSNRMNDNVSYEEILKTAVLVKKKAKRLPYSKFLIEESKSESLRAA